MPVSSRWGGPPPSMPQPTSPNDRGVVASMLRDTTEIAAEVAKRTDMVGEFLGEVAQLYPPQRTISLITVLSDAKARATELRAKIADVRSWEEELSSLERVIALLEPQQ